MASASDSFSIIAFSTDIFQVHSSKEIRIEPCGCSQNVSESGSAPAGQFWSSKPNLTTNIVFNEQAELEKWVKGLESFDAQDYAQALTHFEAIADSSKILFNMALINATMGNHKIAIAYYDQAHTLDQYLAVSFFQ